VVKTIKFDKNSGTIIAKGLLKPIKQAKTFFNILGVKVDQMAQLTFRVLGARAGHKKWIGYNRGRGHILGGTTRTKKGTWNIRYGTDLSGRAKGTYKPGVLRKGIRRYSSSSKLLQASVSGGFRQSFKILTTTGKKLLYGSRMKIAEKIMSDPKRPVLFVTPKDRKSILNLWKIFYLKRMKF